MKKIIYSFYFMAICLFAQAQKDSSKLKKAVSEFDVKNYKADPRDRLILEVNYTNWKGAPKNITTDWKCIGFGFYTLFDKPIKNSNFSFGYGLGFYFHNYSSNANFIYQLDSTNHHTTTVIQPKTIPYTANKYNERSVEIPLELRFRTKTPTIFKMMLGVKVGYVMSNFKKSDDADGRIRVYNIKNVNPWRYGIVFRIGIEQVSLTASYYFSEVFTTRGPNGINPFSVGIAIIPY
ncbi:MAG: outer membrane beta-barrel protein [Bacteroidetes bacterium]|nr:outer membrane beta-barrel protein [Bacteroidota bacterium]